MFLGSVDDSRLVFSTALSIHGDKLSAPPLKSEKEKKNEYEDKYFGFAFLGCTNTSRNALSYNPFFDVMCAINSLVVI